MNSNTRACVAYVACALIGNKRASYVYDYSQSKYISISGTVSKSNANVYDHDRGCYFSGSVPSLYDYGRGCYVSLNISGQNFDGYDYGDGHHFSGSVNGSSINIYDYGKSSHFSYSL